MARPAPRGGTTTGGTTERGAEGCGAAGLRDSALLSPPSLAPAAHLPSLRTSSFFSLLSPPAGFSHLPVTPARTWTRPLSAATMEYAGYNVAPIEFTAKPVSETVRQFMDSYTKPVVPAYRTIINDLLTTTHLGVVDARFTYTPLFGFGVTTIFKEFFKSYPGGKEEVDQIYDAFVASLDLSPETFKADTAACMEAMEGKTEADVLAIFASPDDSALGKTAAAVQAKMQGPRRIASCTRSLGWACSR